MPTAHDAVVTVEPDGSPNAPGGAITVALCGNWDHSPPCPLAPHFIDKQVDGPAVRLRILFAAEPADEQRVRDSIGEALATGQLTGPDGKLTVWQLKSACPSEVRPEEMDHAAGLIAHGVEA